MEESRSWTGHGSLSRDIKNWSASPVRRSRQHPIDHASDTETNEARSWKEGVNTVNFQYMNEYSKSFPRAKFLDLDALSDSGAISDESDEEKKEIGVTFQPEGKWKRDSKCFVCGRIFDQLQGIFRHHCRVCANSVCGECSSKKLKKRRYCDVCHFKRNNQKMEEMRAATLQHYEEKIQKKNEKIKKLRERIHEEKHKILQYSEEAAKEEEHLMKSMLNFEKEYESLNARQATINDSNEKWEKVLNTEKEAIQENNKEFSILTTKLKKLGLEIIDKKTAHLIKIEEFSKLKNILENQFKGNTLDQSESLASSYESSFGGSLLKDKARTYSAGDFGSWYEQRKPSFIREKEEGEDLQPSGSFIEAKEKKKVGICGCKCGFD